MDRTILIVDDEKDMRIMLKRYFELNGYLVHTAGGKCGADNINA